MSRIRHISSHSRNSPDPLQCPQANSATRNDLRATHQSKAVTKFINDPLAIDVEKPHHNKMCHTADDSVDNCEAKISRKHFKSYSNSDISKEMHKRHDVLYEKPEVYEVTYTTSNDSQYPPRFRENKDLNQHKQFKRSVSDTANKKKYTKSRENEFIWNTQSLDTLRRHVVKTKSLNDTTGQTDCESSHEAKRKPSYERKNHKNTRESDKATRFNEYKGYDKSHKNKQDYDKVNLHEDIRKKTCYTKSEIRLYSSSVLKPYEYKQTLHFSTFQPEGNDIKDIGEIENCSSSRGGKNSSFSRSDTLEMERKSKRLENFPSENSIKFFSERNSSLSRNECNSFEMERKSKGFNIFPSEQDAYHFQRKQIYFPSASQKEPERPSREYAHEYSKHSKKENKIAQHSRSKNKRGFEEFQSDTQVRFHWRRIKAIESDEENR